MSKGWLITGVSTGIGRELAEAALARGDRVVGTLRQMVQIGEFEELAPGRAKAMLLELTDTAAVASVVADAAEWLGGIDVLVNNAGYGQIGVFEELTDAEFRRSVETNFLAPVAVIRAALPAMRKKGRGDIINISSIAGVIGKPGLSAYGSAKAALGSLTESLAAELAPFGIRVMVVEPGSFRTSFRAGRAMPGAQVPDYDGSPGGNIRDFMAGARNDQRGDPVKLAQVLVAMVAGEELPVHFLAGSEAVAQFDQRLSELRHDFDEWRELGCSVDVER